jgi:hypothetical protein
VTPALVGVLLALVATLAHEVGHLAGALLVGAEIRGVGLSWVGLSCHVRVDPPCRWRCVVHLLAGPAMNALLAAGCWLGDAWPTFALVNVLLAVFNLTFPKSDGWQAWKVTL